MKMTHPNRPDAKPIEVSADMAAMYESQGWLKAAPAPKTPAKTADDEK